ncbi:hypothetical protein H4219_002525 [Mycoemilia scoparia]|uniref:F5/8 type C domain-containing protein n=1 Tax=Mycoemilia scoparia TaxID=417184 RepID=A0A9W8DQG9_9FUNG|nr:hypothetical protein H4219_002525 [Mycoemilia scoparia]
MSIPDLQVSNMYNYRVIMPRGQKHAIYKCEVPVYDPGSISAVSLPRATVLKPLNTTPGPRSTMAQFQYISTKLQYSIYSWSSQTPRYGPHNIMVDDPEDQGSRWSSANKNHHQYITLELEKPSLVRTITFGKYHKPHVCNLKEFKVYGGMYPDTMTELLHSGLQNDTDAETFLLRQNVGRACIPCRYIKIHPLLAHEQKFSFSIWYVELQGTCDSTIMDYVINAYQREQNGTILRSCLRFLRDNNLDESFEVLQAQTQVKLETPYVANLFKAFVLDNNIDATERLLSSAEQSGYFDRYAKSLVHKSIWRRLYSLNGATPRGRGGHQMCIDDVRGKIYLYGGWDGTQGLGDLWEFDIESRSWACIDTNTEIHGGPGPLSCHSMCYDPKRRQIYIMGNFIAPEMRPRANLQSNLYRYDVESARWEIVMASTENYGGPHLVYDGQMVYDAKHHCIYIYGGRVVVEDLVEAGVVYSGLYRFNIEASKWKMLKPDADLRVSEFHLRGRLFHTMSIDSDEQKLYIFSGQRDRNELGNLYIYDIVSDTFYERPRELMDIIYPNGGRTASTGSLIFDSVKDAPSANIPRQLISQNLPSDDPSSQNGSEGRTQCISFDPIRKEFYLLLAFRSKNMSTKPKSILEERDFAKSQSREHIAPYFSRPHATTESLYSDETYNPWVRQNSSGVFCVANTRRCEDVCNGGDGAVAMVVMSYSLERETWDELYHSDQLVGTKDTCKEGLTDKVGFNLACQANPPKGASLGTPMRRQPMRSTKAKVLGFQNGSTTADGGMATSMPAEVPRYRDSAPHTSSSEFSPLDHVFGDLEVGHPRPRFAQNWVYSTKLHSSFMFGGNSSHRHNNKSRLHDMWVMKVEQPSTKKILRRAMFIVREQRFLDLCRAAQSTSHGASNEYGRAAKTGEGTDSATSEMQALDYLQTRIAEVINHDDPEEVRKFRALTMALFQPWCNEPQEHHTSVGYAPGWGNEQQRSFNDRNKVFNRLVSLLPPDISQPAIDINKVFATLAD